MSSPYVGELRVVGFSFAPKNWALCNGQTLAINQNQALFSLLGTTYGGNGTTTFALPDMRGRVPLHFGTALTQGTALGEEMHTLSTAEMAPHTHQVAAVSGAGTVVPPAGNLMAAGSTGLFASALGTSVTLAAATTTNSGGGQSHENRQPYLVLNVIIALVGVFPSRN